MLIVCENDRQWSKAGAYSNFGRMVVHGVADSVSILVNSKSNHLNHHVSRNCHEKEIVDGNDGLEAERLSVSH